MGGEIRRRRVLRARHLEITRQPEIAQYEDRAEQEKEFGFSFFGGDDYDPGQLDIRAQVDSPAKVLSDARAVLQESGWSGAGTDATGAMQAFTAHWTLRMQQLEEDRSTVEIVIYRRTPAAVVRAITAAWLIGVAIGFFLGAKYGSRAAARPARFLAWGLALSVPAAVVAAGSVVCSCSSRIRRFRSSLGTSICTGASGR